MGTSSRSKSPMERPKSTKGRTRGTVQKSMIVHVKDTPIKEEVGVNHSTQAGDSVGVQTERKVMTAHDFVSGQYLHY